MPNDCLKNVLKKPNWRTCRNVAAGFKRTIKVYQFIKEEATINQANFKFAKNSRFMIFILVNQKSDRRQKMKKIKNYYVQFW